MLFLQSNDVSTAHAAKIYRTYGNESIKIVEENPYKLADDIWGIGFKTADTIALELGIEKNRFMRLRSGQMYTLNKLSENGHCYAAREQLIDQMKAGEGVTDELKENNWWKWVQSMGSIQSRAGEIVLIEIVYE